ncbi:uncharacterized protein [Rutidosis leptorrhynchoides]|uniref:uncharacterized protein n=1 Tax=Rutidosis leptorrhynchoides TaxID=125765 RepID=UPI003A9990C1
MTGVLEVIHERMQLKPLQHEIWELYTDGASCVEGAGAGLVLTSQSGEEHTYALRFNFDVTNNEAKYEALLVGLNMAHKMNVLQLRAYVDSQLVTNQFNGSFEAQEFSMQKYLKLVQEAVEKFEFFELTRVSRSQNKKADALSKLAALTFSHFQKQVWVEELPNKSIDGSLIVAAIEEVQPNWMDPIVCYLCRKKLEAETIIEEVHSGSCALHLGYKTIAAKIIFGIPRELVSNNEAQIAKDPFLSWCAELNIIQKFTSVAHSQENGLCEVTNRDIVSGIRKRLNEKRNGWVDELSNVFWAHRTTFKKGTGETPFSLVYGSEVMIPAEVFVPTHRVANFDESANVDNICENLNFIEERRLMAAIREAKNKQQIAKYYNKKVRALAFDVGEWVLPNNEASRAEKLGKLGPNWKGPFQIVWINEAGSYKLQDIERRHIPNAWHATLLKRYYMYEDRFHPAGAPLTLSADRTLVDAFDADLDEGLDEY